MFMCFHEVMLLSLYLTTRVVHSSLESSRSQWAKGGGSSAPSAAGLRMVGCARGVTTKSNPVARASSSAGRMWVV